MEREIRDFRRPEIDNRSNNPAAVLPTRTVLRLIFIVLAVAAALGLIYKLRQVILLVVLAIFFAYLIAPLVNLISKPFRLRGREISISRTLAIVIVYAALFGSIAGLIYLFLPRL